MQLAPAFFCSHIIICKPLFKILCLPLQYLKFLSAKCVNFLFEGGGGGGGGSVCMPPLKIVEFGNKKWFDALMKERERTSPYKNVINCIALIH